MGWEKDFRVPSHISRQCSAPFRSIWAALQHSRWSVSLKRHRRSGSRSLSKSQSPLRNGQLYWKDNKWRFYKMEMKKRHLHWWWIYKTCNALHILEKQLSDNIQQILDSSKMWQNKWRNRENRKDVTNSWLQNNHIATNFTEVLHMNWGC